MSLVSYEPWNLLDGIHRQLDHMVYADKLYTDSDNDKLNFLTGSWKPVVDIKEEKNRFLIIADIPGVNPKDVEITMENGILTMKGERHSEKENSNGKYKRVERMSGTFYRCFSLPETADGDNIEAKGNNGVIEIVIPKHEKIQPRRIEVKG